MKYDKVEIFARAWRIAENSATKFGGKASEHIDCSLSISWKMAKLEIAENARHLLNMRDISGGKSNTAAQQQIRERDEAIDRLTEKINALRLEIYPEVIVTETSSYLSDKEIESLKKRIVNLETEIESIKSGSNTEPALSKTDELLLKLGLLKTAPKAQDNRVELFRCEEMLRQAKFELENSVRTYTRTVLDVNAYDAVA